MGLFDRIKSGLQKTQTQLVHEIKRIVTRSPRLTEESLAELERALLAADLGVAMTAQIMAVVKKSYETQGGNGLDVIAVARNEIVKNFNQSKGGLRKEPAGVTVVFMIGVNGTGKTTTAAKLAWMVQQNGGTALLAACDTFRAAAIEQIKHWGQRLNVQVISGAHGADAAAVAHDSLSAAQSRNADYLFIDTAGRQHTKSNLMLELQKVHRVIGRKLPGAPHEVLLVLDGATGMNAMNQAREFHKAVPLTGLVITKLDGTSKGGAVLGIQKELGLPVKFIGVGEQPEDLQPFDAAQFAEALFAEK